MLTDLKIKKAKLKSKQYKLYDTQGLHIRINPKGTKVFVFRYDWLNNELTQEIGHYPKWSLVKAREKEMNTLMI